MCPPTEATPLNWEETQQLADHIRRCGIEQFLHLYHATKDRRWTCMYWGEEIEYMLVAYDTIQRNACLALRSQELLTDLCREETAANGDWDQLAKLQGLWRPEYCSYMIEGLPAVPYNGDLAALLTVEKSMQMRRQMVRARLAPNESILTISNFPRLGAPGQFLMPHYPPGGPVCQSHLVPDEMLAPLPRYPVITANVTSRRKRKINAIVPVMPDLRTAQPFYDPTVQEDDQDVVATADQLHLDAAVFGWGCACVQVTQQASDIAEACWLHDQLTPISAILLALTAATPIVRGYLIDTDTRWHLLSQCVDDRTREELGETPLKQQRYRMNKSRYDSVMAYVSSDPLVRAEYNDAEMAYDTGTCQHLIDSGVEAPLARHIAHLFTRDPLITYREHQQQPLQGASDHFENLQSTNWRAMRLKPPPPQSDIGWRVECRTMEIQLTDFENAAFSIFVVLLTRALLCFDLNFLVPISKVDDNMRRAQQRDAVEKATFYFRRQIIGTRESNRPDLPIDDEYELMTIHEIINGKSDSAYPGLLSVVHWYLDSFHLDPEFRLKINRYLHFIRDRANGTLMTTASWMRQFVQSHPDYRQDSVVSQSINYDLMQAMDDITYGRRSVPELLGDYGSRM